MLMRGGFDFLKVRQTAEMLVFFLDYLFIRQSATGMMQTKALSVSNIARFKQP